jgi:hypothetical protein
VGGLVFPPVVCPLAAGVDDPGGVEAVALGWPIAGGSGRADCCLALEAGSAVLATACPLADAVEGVSSVWPIASGSGCAYCCLAFEGESVFLPTAWPPADCVASIGAVGGVSGVSFVCPVAGSFCGVACCPALAGALAPPATAGARADGAGDDATRPNCISRPANNGALPVALPPSLASAAAAAGVAAVTSGCIAIA